MRNALYRGKDEDVNGQLSIDIWILRIRITESFDSDALRPTYIIYKF